MATHSLDSISDEHYFDFDIFSISCLESIYRVVYEINKALHVDLQIVEFLEYEYQGIEMFYFPLYSFMDEGLNIELNVLPNKTSFQPPKENAPKLSLDLFSDEVEKTMFLIPELDKANYFLMIKGNNRHLYNHQISQSLQSVPLFTAVNEIFLNDLKNKRSKFNLLF